MQHTCQDCDHSFTIPGQNEPHIQPAVQCPQCHSYRTQPAGIPDEANDMLHGLQAMPDSTQDDMAGNPLQEGILGDWQNRDKRDETFASVRHVVSLFETPEFETTQIVAPPDLYRHGLETEAAHRHSIQIPQGITDNLHATLGNLGAWVENPYENGEPRPYNKYWKTIRPSFMKPGALQIGVADPTMAEIINHVAQTDDLTPLYEYRGKTASTKVAGPLLALAPEAMAGIAGGLGEAGAAGAAGAGEAAGAAGAAGAGEAGAGAAAGGTSASGVGGLLKTVAPGLNMVDDVLGGGGAPGSGGGGGGGASALAPAATDMSYYAATDEDDAHPEAHDEVPKQDDGDYHEQDDGNHHEWQRDISVNGTGGTDHSPSFDSGGPAFQRLMMLAPLLLQMIDNGEDGSNDPLVQGLHQALEAEIPGYLDHADPHAAEQLVMVLRPKDKTSEPTAEPEKNEADHTDENSGGQRESKVVSLEGEAAEFLPDFTVTAPALNGFTSGIRELQEIAQLREGLPPETQAQIDLMLRHGRESDVINYLREVGIQAPASRGTQGMPYWDTLNMNTTGNVSRTADAMPMGPPMGAMGPGAMGPPPPSPMSGPPAMPATPPGPDQSSSQGPVTDEQQAWFANWLKDRGREDEIPAMLRDPALYAKEFAQARQQEVPPQATDDAQSAEPPMPAQEEAPPGDTMPVPGMEQQMMAAVTRYAADSVAGRCPKCHGHTTALLDEDGTSSCHSCGHTFKTEGKTPNKIDSTASTWNVDEDLRKEADSGDLPSATDDPTPVQGVPIADQQHQPDLRDEGDSGHTWSDEEGNPLKVGQEYEMYSEKYDIPDLIRIEAVKPSSLVYTLTGEFGLEHSTELTKQEANIEGVTFRPNIHEGELGTSDDGSLEENNDDHTGYSGEPERTDASAPTGLVSASVIKSGVPQQGNPSLAWLTEGMQVTAGANYTPMEQRALIDESGIARNADLLDLANTHYVQSAEDDQFLFGL